MKLKNELPEMERRFLAVQEKIKEYAPILAASGDYTDYVSRLAWDVLYATYKARGVCELYEKYNCTDKHIETAARRALLAVYPDAKEGF